MHAACCSCKAVCSTQNWHELDAHLLHAPHLFSSRHLLPRLSTAGHVRREAAALVVMKGLNTSTDGRAAGTGSAHTPATCTVTRLLGRRLWSRGGSPSNAGALQGEGRTALGALPSEAVCRACFDIHPRIRAACNPTCLFERRLWRRAGASSSGLQGSRFGMVLMAAQSLLVELNYNHYSIRNCHEDAHLVPPSWRRRSHACRAACDSLARCSGSDNRCCAASEILARCSGERCRAA